MSSIILKPITPVCDFCSNPEPITEYDVDPFLVDDLTKPRFESVGAWMACRQCAEMIEADFRMDLIEHALQSFRTTYANDPSMQNEERIRRTVVTAQSRFWAAYEKRHPIPSIEEVVDNIAAINEANELLRRVEECDAEGEALNTKIRFRFGLRLGVLLKKCGERDLTKEIFSRLRERDAS